MIKKVESRNYSTMHIVLFIIVFMDVGWMSEWTTRKKVNNEHVRGVNEWKNKWMEWRTNQQTNERMCIQTNERTDNWSNERTIDWMNDANVTPIHQFTFQKLHKKSSWEISGSFVLNTLCAAVPCCLLQYHWAISHEIMTKEISHACEVCPPSCKSHLKYVKRKIYDKSLFQ